MKIVYNDTRLPVQVGDVVKALTGGEVTVMDIYEETLLLRYTNPERAVQKGRPLYVYLKRIPVAIRAHVER